jgi:Tfp pilus assembly protein PilX
LRYPGDGRALGDYVTLQSLIGGADNCGSNPYTGVCISGNPANPHFAVNQIGNGSKQSWNTGHDYLTVNADNPYDSSSDYAGAARVMGTTGVAGNAAAGLLTLGSGATARGKYWVEIFPYNTTGGANPTSLAPDGSYPLVFRITAMAKGLRGNTVSVLRTYYVPYPVVSN